LNTLRIVADAHIHAAAQAFAQLPGHRSELRILEHPQITRAALREADVLITRSSTRVDAELLADTPVRFVATATIGDDHLDKAYLTARGIAWANAAGSSTDSVVEYMLTVLLTLQAQARIDLPSCTLGIIGAGRIGGKLAAICRRLGMRVLLNDPPRARAEGPAGFHALADVLTQADVLSLHTPLTHTGPDASHHLLDAPRLAAFRGSIIINAARGACVDNRALLDWLDARSDRYAVLDCWEHEPAPDPTLIRHPRMLLATPHIAGHSLDGKAANTWYAYRALCRWLGVPPTWDVQTSLPEPPASPRIACGPDPWDNLYRAAVALYPIQRDDAAMRQLARLDPCARGEAFRHYRRHYPVRRSWIRQGVRLLAADERSLELATTLGMRVPKEAS